MSNIKSHTVLAFSKGHSFVISPIELHSKENIERDIFDPNDKRSKLLLMLHGMLEAKDDIQYQGGIIKILELNADIVTGSNYWGGNGLEITISKAYNSKDLSIALDEIFIVFDLEHKRYFRNGVEQTFAKSSSQLIPVNP